MPDEHSAEFDWLAQREAYRNLSRLGVSCGETPGDTRIARERDIAVRGVARRWGYRREQLARAARIPSARVDEILGLAA
jgi:hypothetical protein